MDEKSKAYKEYTEREKTEHKEGFSIDMALTITWEKLGERIIFWERFMMKYPDFTERDTISRNLYLYIYVFFYGLDNSWAFEIPMDDEATEMVPELKKVYEGLY